MNILILYYSGVGNTKMVATKIFDLLYSTHEVTLASIEKLSINMDIANYDSLVIGFPTIHAPQHNPYLPLSNRQSNLKKLFLLSFLQPVDYIQQIL